MSIFRWGRKALVPSLSCWMGAGALCAALAGCGGDEAAPGVAPLASGTTHLELEAEAPLPDAVAALTVQPLFHAAPMVLVEPPEAQAEDADAAFVGPARVQALAPEDRGLPTRNRTPHLSTRPVLGAQAMPVLQPLAGTVVSTYTPAQIRAAYGFPALPATGTPLTPAQAALQGAGQTIYVIAAHHNPNTAAELAVFNQHFALPGCTSSALPVGTALPLAPAPTTGCVLATAYSTSTGTLTATVPSYDAGWATEIALDVQWAHATAPLARIVVIEAADASLNGILGAVRLANQMGPGVVSMSLGVLEGSWTTSTDAAFSAANMTYLAATGDDGAGVSWPAVSSRVLGVGGTSLSYAGTGARSEVTWPGSGGGTSLYTLAPSYQNKAVPGLGTLAFRRVADVAFNADPLTGQYVALIAPGTPAARWVSAGGTSLATPQWAGLIAIANASRALSGKAALGAPHGLLYGQIASVPGTYAGVFLDITQGADGSCATCAATAGYDAPTGLGTPNVSSLLSTLFAAGGGLSAPVVTSANVAGVAGTPFSFTALVSSSHAAAYALSGAPAGMAVNALGVVAWANPLAGTYAVTLQATDTVTGQVGQGLYTITVQAPQAPTGSGATFTGKPGVALSFTALFTGANPLRYSLAGAPAGMAIGSSGGVTWPSPVLGTYSVAVTATDTRTGLSGKAVYTVKIATTTTSTTAGPVITAPALRGVVGQALAGQIGIAAPGASSFTVSISGAPQGLRFAISAGTIAVSWPSPVAGSYNLSVSVVDSSGKSATATVPVTVAAR
ncbi:MAG: S53 family peptidase [Burkholderiaceae bacterium]|nr:S53 family peptidase [Burkholderiaceae bacterium]